MSEWTSDLLKTYFEQRFADSDKAIQAALVAQEKAIMKAENSAERRFELLNELRVGVATKEQLDALEKVVEALSKLVYIGLGGVLALQLVLKFIK